MDEIVVVGTSKPSKNETLKLPSMRKSRQKFLNLSQNYSTEFSEENVEKPNISLTNDLFDAMNSSRGLRKVINTKRHYSEAEEAYSSKPLSPGLGIKGIITPTHARILKPIIKKTSLPLGVAKKRKPLKLLGKPLPQLSLKQEIFTYWGDIIRSTSGVEVLPLLAGSYKYYIGKGNNGSLVNHLIKSRFWWNRVDTADQANLVWTQLKHKSTLEKTPASENSEPFLQQMSAKRVSSGVIEQEKVLGISLLKESSYYCKRETSAVLQCGNLVAHNRLPNNFHICNKKSLFKNLKDFYGEKNIDVFSKIPLTFHVEQGLSDPAMAIFIDQFKENSMWIIKPGECTNRGNGIKVSNELQEIKEIISSGSSGRTYIVQKYIEKPLLINKRKFDIRCYALVTCVNGILQAYFYREGYLRTASKEFSLRSVHDKFVHLTNDAIQKNSEDYGKFEAGNKLSYGDFQKFLAVNHPEINFCSDILPEIENIVRESIESVQDLLMNQKKSLTFEVFGYDFMIDSDFKVWLIEVNTNPCLELSCSYLAKLIPEMLENAFKIALDPIFPPQLEHKKFKNWVEDMNLNNKFALIFSAKC